jgi:hypothetical protein
MAACAAPLGESQARQGVSALIAFSDGQLRWNADGNRGQKRPSFDSFFVTLGIDPANI